MAEQNAQHRIAIIGLGYVGLPVALAFAREYPGIIAFDINKERITALNAGRDDTLEISESELKSVKALFTSDPADLKKANFFVVAVPTPIDEDKRPDLRALVGASETVGRALSKGAIVVYESTVYPGVTEDICGPVLEKVSGLKCGVDFKLGYSPERINPGDREHTLENVIKVVSGQDADSLEIVSKLYGKVVKAGVHRASSIKVAEAAKVIENTQRDLNIALMNELALIFDRMQISTKEVLDAAGTKWNFLRFSPGLVGGHCIGVDPYYLTTKAEQLGYQPQVILAGRRINDGMGSFIAQRVVKLLIHSGSRIKGARVGILGLTFKENVTDIRNSRVPDIIAELKEFGITPLVHEPLGSAEEIKAEYGIELSPLEAFRELDATIFAVAHKDYMTRGPAELCSTVRSGGVFIDVKSAFEPSQIPKSLTYWRL